MSDIAQDFGLTCNVTFGEEPIEAAAGDGGERQPTFAMVAYTGDAISQKPVYPHPVVVDLAGLDISRQTRPIRFNHDSGAGVGHTHRIAVENGVLVASGVISRDTEAAREVVASGKRGFPWQASIGARPVEVAYVKAGDKATVNGREFVGPLHLVRKAVLTEISFVDLGADDKTSASIAASSKESIMAEEKVDVAATGGTEPQDVKASEKPASRAATLDLRARQAEHAARKARIEAITEQADVFMGRCPEYIDEITAEAERFIEENRDAAAFKQFGELRWIPSINARPPVQALQDAVSAKMFEAGLCLALRLDNPEAIYGEQTVEAAHKRWKHGLGIHELLLEAGHRRGYRGHTLGTDGALKACLRAIGEPDDIRAAGFSTIDVTGILGNVANKAMVQSFDSVESSWRPISRIRSVKDFKTAYGYALGSAGVAEKVGPGGELKHLSLSETEYTNRLDTYGAIIAINRQDLINDDLGALNAVASKLGRSSALGFNNVFWKEWLADNSTFYTAGRGNYTSGGATALSSASLEAVDVLFHSLKDPDNNPMGLMPRFLLVPHNIKVAALELVSSGNINTGGAASTTKVPNRNVWAGMFDVVVSTYLSSSSITGSSTTAWWLLASPQDCAVIEVAFLNGNERPTVENGEVDFSSLGMQWRCYFDYGVRKQEYRGGVKSAGA